MPPLPPPQRPFDEGYTHRDDFGESRVNSDCQESDDETLSSLLFSAILVIRSVLQHSPASHLVKQFFFRGKLS